jgi:hypothetical protein
VRSPVRPISFPRFKTTAAAFQKAWNLAASGSYLESSECFRLFSSQLPEKKNDELKLSCALYAAICEAYASPGGLPLFELTLIARRSMKISHFGLAGLAEVQVAAFYLDIGSARAARSIMRNACHNFRKACVEELNPWTAFAEMSWSEDCALMMALLLESSVLPCLGPNVESVLSNSSSLETENKGPPIGLTRMEEKLFNLLLRGPQTLYQLSDAIYGSVGDPLKSESRVKNLLSRVRSKFEGRIIYDGRAYRLAQDSVEEHDYLIRSSG